MNHDDCDFSGWATKNNITCLDGRTIRKDAFIGNDGKKVPLVWNHQHNSVSDVLGHAWLENRDEGVYAYCKFNNTRAGQDAKESLRNGDIESMSIWANELVTDGPDVLHGEIREVSLVLSGANPGALIESVMIHGVPIDDSDDEGIFYTSEPIVLSHALSKEDEGTKEKSEETIKSKSTDEKEGETVKDVFDTLNDKQKKAVAIIVNDVMQNSKKEEKPEKKKEEEEMKHNIFEGAPEENVISHDAMKKIMADAKRLGSLKESVYQNIESGVLAHSIDTTGVSKGTGSQTYGFNDASMLFPDARSVTAQPEFIRRDMTWVDKVLSQVHPTPFSRIKSIFADITEDEARAKGYIKGKQKKEEVFTILKRTTTPQTIYKKQKLDRDDILDITDFDVVTWIKAEMEMMLREEKARAILIGDGRQADAEDKIAEDHVRPVAKDVPLFNTTVVVSAAANAKPDEIAKSIINSILRSRKKYKGSGTPTYWTTEDYLSEMLLLEDTIGHKLYKSEGELATTLRVSEIVPVEPMEGMKITYGSKQLELVGIIANLRDYNVGSDRRAEDSGFFEDFDIDFNQQKYLKEARFSGALVKPFSAVTILLDKATTTPSTPPSQGSGDSEDQ